MDDRFHAWPQRSGYGTPPQLHLAQKTILTKEADFALNLIERWGLVAALPDGEDSAGRAKLRLPTPEELTARAFDMAAAAFAEAAKRGMVIDTPSFEEIEEMAKLRPDSN